MLEVSSRLGVSPFVLVTSDIPVGLGEMEYDDFDEDFLRIPVGLGEKDEDYVLECGHDDDAEERLQKKKTLIVGFYYN